MIEVDRKLEWDEFMLYCTSVTGDASAEYTPLLEKMEWAADMHIAVGRWR